MTPFNPTTYNWISTHPGIYRRPALSAEALWSTRPKELHEIFVTAKLSLGTTSTRGALENAAVHAWRRLRYEVPELGVHVVMIDGEVFLEYDGIDEWGMEGWTGRSLFFDGGGEHEFEGLRESISSRTGREEQASILLHFSTSSRDRVDNGAEEELVDSIHVILNTDHQITDGIGTRILLGRFLELFSSCVGGGVEDEDLLVWEESYKNLSKPWIGMLDGKQKLEGREFDEAVEKKKNYLYHKISPKTNPSLPLKQHTNTQPSTSEISTQKTHFHTFSPQKTTSLLSAIKKINKQANITHAVHAAMTLALLSPSFNHSQAIFSTFNSSCWLNGRRYLSPSEKNHIPLCQSFFPIIFSDLEALKLKPDASGEERKEVMVKTMELAMQQYMLLKEEGERGLVLGSMIRTGEEIGRVLRSRRMDEKVEGEVKERKRDAVPLFLSDGITENYISRSYPDGKDQEKQGEARSVFEVEDIHFGANAGGEVILRIATFRSQLRFSIEWKEDLFDAEMVRGVLEDVRTFLISLL